MENKRRKQHNYIQEEVCKENNWYLENTAFYSPRFQEQFLLPDIKIYYLKRKWIS